MKSLRDVFEESRLRVACYMSMSDNRWIKAAWKREKMKKNNSIKNEAIVTMQSKGKHNIGGEDTRQTMETSLEIGEIMLQNTYRRKKRGRLPSERNAK